MSVFASTASTPSSSFSVSSSSRRLMLMLLSSVWLLTNRYHTAAAAAAAILTTVTAAASTSVSSTTTCTTGARARARGRPSNILLSNGLVNLGNTCYLNAQLQCAYHIPRVRNLILVASGGGNVGGGAHSDDDDADDATTTTPITNRALLSLGDVFGQMVQASTTRNASTAATSTRKLCLALDINPYLQQDAQEFWKLLLPELDYDPLLQLYRGEYETYLTALDGSNREKRRKEIFMDLSLDVMNFDHVMDSLSEMFASGEILSVEEGNGWKPEKGVDEWVDAVKGNTLKRDGLPKILQLHLMRFRHDWETGVVSKINDRFVFEKVLNLQPLMRVGEEKDGNGHDGGNDGCEDEKDVWYDLQSVVVHVGEYGSGHYYAYVRPDVRSHEWFRYDDDRVTPVSFQEVQDDAFGGRVLHQRNEKHKKKKKMRMTTMKMGQQQQQLKQEKRWTSKVCQFWGKTIWKSAAVRMGVVGDENRPQYGWGGRTSSAYMLQYVKRSDVEFLYD